MGPTWGSPGSCRPQMGPMLATCTLLSGLPIAHFMVNSVHQNLERILRKWLLLCRCYCFAVYVLWWKCCIFWIRLHWSLFIDSKTLKFKRIIYLKRQSLYWNTFILKGPRIAAEPPFHMTLENGDLCLPAWSAGWAHGTNLVQFIHAPRLSITGNQGI